MGENRLRCLMVRNKTETSAELYIHGDIVDDAYKMWLSDYDNNTYPGYVLPVDVREELESLKGKDLTVYINSDGGSVPAGMTIANILKRHDGRTVGIVDGWAASIASVIFMACDERHMPSNTFLMIHKPSAVAIGSATDMRRVADSLDTVQQGIEQVYRERAVDGVTEEAIHAAVEAETWYTAAEAAEMFDLVVDDATVEMVAYSKSVDFKSLPEAVRAAKLKNAAPQDPDEPIDDESTRRRKLQIELELLR